MTKLLFHSACRPKYRNLLRSIRLHGEGTSAEQYYARHYSGLGLCGYCTRALKGKTG